jgi:SAM-dependent methyltransferase
VAGLQRQWDKLGRTNPKWAVCTTKRDRQWDDDEFFATGTREVDALMAYLDEQVPGLRREDALDFGCGVGRLTRALAAHFGHALGIDVAPSMVAEARRLDRADRCTFVVNDTPDLRNLADGTVDLVYCTMVFQHMARALTAAYLGEFRRVLRDGGAAVFTMTTEPARTWRGRGWRWIPRPIIHAYKRRHDGAGAVMEMHGIGMAGMTTILAGHGFAVEDVRASDVGAPDWLAFRYLARPA